MGSEMQKGPPSPGGQAIEIVIQDSVDPPQTVDLHYWVGCEAGEHEKCDDSNFNGLPEPIEYRSKTLTTPEIRAGGLNVFNGLIDDSMLVHRDKVAFYVTGQDGQGNVIAMGGGPYVIYTHHNTVETDLEMFCQFGRILFHGIKYVRSSNQLWILIIPQ